MIIACPECTSPFEVADGHIAPLVQIECPTCNFRMILDFAAANDASLREPGMAMTQGFLDEASYRLAVGGGVAAGGGVAVGGGRPPAYTEAERPSLRAVPDQGIEPPIEKPPVAEPPIEKPPIRQPVIERPEPVIEPPIQPALEAVAPELELDKPPVRHPQPDRRPRATLIAHTPPVPRPVVAPPEPELPEPELPPGEQVAEHAQPAQHAQPAEQPRSEAQIETHVGRAPEPDADLDVDVDVDEPELTPEAKIPPVEPAVTTTKPSTQPEEAEPDEDEDKDKRKRSPVRTVLTLLLLLILLAVGGLMIWSLVTTGHPYQKLLELSGLASPQDPKADSKDDGKASGKADAKSDKQAEG